MTDFRALCAELADELTQFNAWYIEDNGYGLPALEALLRRSDAALAQSDEPAVPEGREPTSVVGNPTDEELLTLLPQSVESGFWLPGGLPSDWVDGDFIAPPEAIVAFARDVLELWGCPAPASNPWKDTLLDALVCNFLLNAENEDDPRKALNDLIAWEKQLATDPLINPAPQPVPISERLPGDQLCWWYEPDEDDDGIGYGGKWTLLRIRGCVSCYTHWLPAHALPLPTAND